MLVERRFAQQRRASDGGCFWVTSTQRDVVSIIIMKRVLTENSKQRFYVDKKDKRETNNKSL